MTRFPIVAALTALAFAILAPLSQALAQAAPSPTAVALPLGEWLRAAADIVIPIAVAAVAWMIRHIPGRIGEIIRAAQVEQLLAKAITYGVNATASAAADKIVTVEVGNKVVKEALDYAIRNAPSIVEWAGGRERVREKIIARLTVVPEVALR